ncbi:hypothetical protein ACOBQJ_10885, partial [Pelotomaculum propionicicum]|uniref:hypothetical protein n=1 Tax=Pelotomaculum propionicicum TaxID=258475 RepID=UPI003B797464
IQVTLLCLPGLPVKNAEEKCVLKNRGKTLQMTFSRKGGTARLGRLFYLKSVIDKSFLLKDTILNNKFNNISDALTKPLPPWYLFI